MAKWSRDGNGMWVEDSRTTPFVFDGSEWQSPATRVDDDLFVYREWYAHGPTLFEWVAEGPNFRVTFPRKSAAVTYCRNWKE